MDNYEIIYRVKPPIYKEIKRYFPDVDSKRVIITYGNKIYTENELTQDLLAHELTHIRQQELLGPEVWWNQYFKLKEFRYAQELEAYREQLRQYKTSHKDRNKIDKFTRSLASCLCSSMYGSICPFSQAYGDIKKKWPLGEPTHG